MISNKKLLAIYNNAKGNNDYYSFDSFKIDVKDYLKTIRTGRTVCSMHVSRSGMFRRFNFDRFNMVLNIAVRGVKSWDAIPMSGCGMDMHWYLKFSACERLATKGENEKYNYNSRCSSGTIL